jgi:hypothetical protein
MSLEDSAQRCAQAAEEFDRHENRGDGAQVVGGLHSGLTVLRDALYLRAHEDVERLVGRDSMLIPPSPAKSELAAKTEIEVYHVAESAAAAGRSGYVDSADDWYLRWLARLRLGDAQADDGVQKQLALYAGSSADQRRLAFSDALVAVLPEAGRVPLVLFRLAPLSVQIVTALAFADRPTAEQIRERQRGHLPAIGDCQKCQGRVLENGEQCAGCGNPLWRSEWLTSAD